MVKINPKLILDVFYPVGSYYETSDTSFNPNTAWGGTWQEDTAGRITIAYNSSDNDFKPVGHTGGSKTHTQTTDEVAPHTHQLWIENDQTGGDYGLSQNNMVWQKTKNNWANGQFGVNRTNVNTAQPMNIMNPYVVVKRWHRTA